MGEGRHHQRVAVGLGLGDVFRADDGAGAGLVLDDHGAAELLGHLLRERARDDVGAAAGRERHDDPGHLAGEIGGARCRRQSEADQGGEQELSEA